MTTPINQPIVLEDRFRAVAEQVLTEAKNAATARDELDREIGIETDRDKADEAEQQRLERELEQVRTRRAERAKWLNERLAMRRTAAGEADRLEGDGRRALAVIEQMSQQGEPVAAALEAAPPSADADPVTATRVEGEVTD